MPNTLPSRLPALPYFTGGVGSGRPSRRCDWQSLETPGRLASTGMGVVEGSARLSHPRSSSQEDLLLVGEGWGGEQGGGWLGLKEAKGNC